MPVARTAEMTPIAQRAHKPLFILQLLLVQIEGAMLKSSCSFDPLRENLSRLFWFKHSVVGTCRKFLAFDMLHETRLVRGGVARMGEQEKQTTQQTAQTETTGQSEQQQIATLNVPQAILFSIGVLSELAWQKMGLHINPVTKQIEPDMRQARLAIDTIALLIEMVREWVDEREYDSLRTLLANLRLNFAEQAQKQQTQQ
jgi:hypothetical protein